VADNTSGNSEELKLRITPELNDAALKKVQDQLDAIKTTTDVGGTGKGTGASQQTNAIKQQTAALKEKIAVEKLDIDQIDLRLRKTRTAANQEIKSIKERAAAGKITMEQMNEQILQQQSIIDTATVQADVAYKTVATSLENLGEEYRDTADAAQILTTAEKKLYHAQGRMTHGMDSMSGSMQTVVSQTKMANLAFMNFGRIVQDAPFGLIGIANNIDPLLMSFAMLSNEMDDTTKKTRGAMGAFKAMGAQLFGPAGLIFLLGSALPSALLVLQSRQQKASKESDILAEALKRVADEFGRLASEAAGEEGVENVRKEFETTSQTLDVINAQLKEIDDNINQQISLARDQARLNRSGVFDADEFRKKLEDQYGQRLKNLRTDKQLLESNKEQLEIKIETLGTEERIGIIQKENGIAATLSIKEQIELQEKLNNLRIRVLEITDPIQAEILQEQGKIKKLIDDVWQNTEMSFVERDIQARKLGVSLSEVEEKVRAKHAEKSKEIKVEDERLYKSREELLLAFNKFVQTSLTNRVDDEKASLKEILDSEYTTAEERVRAIAVSNRNILLLLKDFENQATKADDEFAKNRLAKLKESQPLPGPTEFDTFLQNREAMLNLELEYAQLTGNKVLEINKQKEIDLRNLFIQYQKLNLLDTEQYANAKKAIELNAERDTAQVKIDSQTEIFQAIGELASASIGMIFGENKNAQVAQVVIDTIMGIQKIWSQAGLNPVVGALGSAALAAKGLTAINKIKSTTTKSSSISGGSGGATTREVMAEGIGPRAGQIINPYGTIMSANAQPTNTTMMADISIDARVDRRGLAIAVREGEQEIRTQQFSYT
jgi:hypothetical protein